MSFEKEDLRKKQKKSWQLLVNLTLMLTILLSKLKLQR